MRYPSCVTMYDAYRVCRTSLHGPSDNARSPRSVIRNAQDPTQRLRTLGRRMTDGCNFVGHQAEGRGAPAHRMIQRSRAPIPRFSSREVPQGVVHEHRGPFRGAATRRRGSRQPRLAHGDRPCACSRTGRSAGRLAHVAHDQRSAGGTLRMSSRSHATAFAGPASMTP
jgi:hypothetical protein